MRVLAKEVLTGGEGGGTRLAEGEGILIVYQVWSGEVHS